MMNTGDGRGEEGDKKRPKIIVVLRPQPTCVLGNSGEGEAARGGLGYLEAKYLLPLALTHAGKLDKFGA